MALLSLLLCLLGCADPIDDRFTTTRAACGLGDRSPAPAWTDDPACREALSVDLGLDPSTFEDPAVYEPALRGAYELLVRDMGSVGKLRAGPYVRDPFLDEIDALQAVLGGDDLGRLVYNFVAHHIERTRPDDPDAGMVMTFDVLRDTLQLHPDRADTLSPRFAAHALVHEAAHDLYPRHVPCPGGDGELRCDESWAGAYGFEVAVADLAWRYCDGGPQCWEYDFARWSQSSFILE